MKSNRPTAEETSVRFYLHLPVSLCVYLSVSLPVCAYLSCLHQTTFSLLVSIYLCVHVSPPEVYM